LQALIGQAMQALQDEHFEHEGTSINPLQILSSRVWCEAL